VNKFEQGHKKIAEMRSLLKQLAEKVTEEIEREAKRTFHQGLLPLTEESESTQVLTVQSREIDTQQASCSLPSPFPKCAVCSS
jgi:vacuolar-type H+-ATPase subunit E/Vma4